ncbi:MAG: outer membrane protein assembly factor BamA [Polyangiaceae bacterium]|nr:outer membrane protein assembly factor BamA [Polyangiaceae bacterium]
MLLWWLGAILAVLLPSHAAAQTGRSPSPGSGITTPAILPASEAEQAAGQPIAQIEVAGNRRVTREDILSYLRERVGETFNPTTLQKDVRELWNSGFFEDIEVDLARADGGVILRFLVRERPSILRIDLEGNDKIDDEDIEEGIELRKDTILSPAAVARSIQKIRDLYAEKGYFLAEVESEILPQKNNEVIVKLTVRENGSVTVKRVTFIGNDNLPEKELREVMFTGRSSILSFGSGGPYRQDAFERDIAMLSALYYDRGYLEVAINTPRVMLTPDRSGIEISITIEEGPRYRIRQLRVYERGPNGQEVEPINGRRHLRNLVRAEPGDYFNRAELLDDLQAIRTMYRDHGFANVEANPETHLDEARHEVDVIVPVIRGPLVRFERLEFRGNEKTRDRVLRRELEIEEGQPFHETNLEESRKRITALGYFDRVDVSTEEGSAPDKLRVYFEVTERPTGTFQVGVGFSSIENFIATAQVQQANFFGHGQNVSLQGQYSQLRRQVNLQYIEPYFLNTRFSMSLDLFDVLRNYNDFSQSSLGGALTFGYPLIEPRLAASVTYSGTYDEVSTDTRSTIFGTSSTVSVFRRLPLANLFNDGFTSSIRPAITYDSRNNRLFPTAGVYLRGSTEFASAAFGSENQFLRHRGVARIYVPLPKKLVLKFNAEAGHVTSPTSDGVPIFARFFLGGIMDLRGYRFRTVGPRLPLTSTTDPNSAPYAGGANIGGNLEYVQNLELEFPIVESLNVRGVFFTDAGNAWNIERNYCEAARGNNIPKVQQPCFEGIETFTHLRTSYGAGFRWFSPMGPLRFEWGFPIRRLPHEQPMVFEFTIGNFF